MYEVYLLPILALLGLAYFLDSSGDDDDGDTDPVDPPVEPDVNYMQFGAEDDISGGTDGDDAMYMGDGDDFATGGEGDDKIFFGDGQDKSVALNADGSFDNAGMEGDDFIRGGDGRDILVDSLGSNIIYGDTGYDRMNSVDDADDLGTADTMYGGFGEDVLFGDSGDTLFGGGQDDKFQIVVTDTANPAVIEDYQAGEEFALRDPDGGFYITERITSALTEDGEDTNVMLDGDVVLVLKGVTEIEEGALKNPTAPPMYGERVIDEDGVVVDDDFDDDIVINDYAHAVYSFGGDDTISFAEGAATADRDMLINAGDGDDVVTSGDGDDTIIGGLGADTITGGLGNDEILGGYGNDEINTLDLGVPDGSDIVEGGEGNDLLIGDDGDALSGGAGVDTFEIDMSDPIGEAVRIGDFDPGNETLSGTVALASGVTPNVTFAAAVDGSGTDLGAYVLVEGRVVALLIDVDPADLDATNVSFTNSTP